MDWKDVGEWVKRNAGPGAALAGALITGNVPAAITAGISLVATATGHAVPDEALQQLQTDPATVVRLKELVLQNEASVREHIRAMAQMQLQDEQAEQHETQETVRAGDRAEDRFVRWTRPGQSWASLGAAFAYVFLKDNPSMEVVMALLTLPWAYAGLRQIGKGVDAVTAMLSSKGAK